jgi:hypothetical protein
MSAFIGVSDGDRSASIRALRQAVTSEVMESRPGLAIIVDMNTIIATFSAPRAPLR